MNGRSCRWSEPAVDAVVAAIREAIQAVVGSSLVGLYLFGSLTTGDFDPAVSDLDLLAVLTDTPDAPLAARLRRMHAELARAHPAWDDRIEVIYISAHGLARCQTHPTTIAVISPGEPFHLVEAGRDWILNWYPARAHGVRLLGPPIDTLIPPIPIAEYLEEVRRSLVGFTNRIPDEASPRLAGVRDPDDVPRAVCASVRRTPVQGCGGGVGAAAVPTVGRPHRSGAWLAPAATGP